jgi:hypothetical protein
MTREEFIEELDKNNYRWSFEGDTIVITDERGIDLDITTIPSNVEFRNGAYVYLDSLESLPPNIKFNNIGSVSLDSLNSISPGTSFENGRSVFFDSLGINTLLSGKKDSVLNIEGIDLQRLLNVMISLGLFDKSR